MSILSPYASCLAVLSGAVLTSLSVPSLGLAQQVVPDNTLRNESSVVTPLGGQTNRIDGGALRDATLFHSFEQFGIPENHGVYFSNPAAVNTILSRVTGAEPSLLFGTLGVLGDADLVFLNPHGILFGPNAELDLRGGFTATTASGVAFPGGEVFSAVVPDAAPVLSVNVEVPVGLVFEGETPAAIVNQGNLTVDEGQILVLLGGSFANSGMLYAPGGRASVAAAPGNHGVQFERTGELQSWSALTSEPLTYEGLSIETLMISSGLDLATLPADSSLFEPGTTVVGGRIDASSDTSIGGTVQVLGDRVALVDAIATASGTLGGGDIFIGGDYQGQGELPTASRTFIGSNTLITADALQEGDGGRVIVWANGDTSFLGNITAQGGAVVGDGGFVEVSGSEDLKFLGDANTQAPNGDGGTVLLDPRDLVIVNGSGRDDDGELSDSTIFASDRPNDDFTISEEALELLSTQSDNIWLRARRNITIENLSDNGLTFTRRPGATVTFEANFDPSQNGNFSMDSSDRIDAQQWNVNISGNEITIGTIGVSAFAFPDRTENAGSITINALDDVKVLGAINIAADPINENIQGSLDAVASVSGSGNGGRIEVISQNGFIEIPNGAVDVSAQDGIAGDIFIQAGGEISLTGLRAFIFPDGSGNGGNIEVISTNSGINTTAGFISSTSPDGNGGDITLRANSDIFTEDISSIVDGTGNAGKIDVRSDNGIVDTTGGSLNASTPDGTGGEIIIEADQNITTGTLRSSFGTGNNGNITLISNNGDIDTTPGSIRYPSSSRDAVRLTAAGTVEIDTIDSTDLRITGGDISHARNTTINADDSARFTSTLGGITLGRINAGSLNANANTLIISNNTITVNGSAQFTSTLGDITLDRINAGSLLEVNANGIVTTNDAIDVDGTALFTSVTDDIVLDDIDADNLQVNANGSITGNGILTIRGDASFTSQATGAGTVKLASQNDTIFGNSLVGGDLIADITGQTSQTGVLQVAGDIVVNGAISEGPGAPLINTVGDPRQNTSLADGTVIITGIGTVPLGEAGTITQYPANLIVNSLTEGVQGFNQVLNDRTAIDVSNTGNSFGGTVQFRTEIGDADIISGIPGIAQEGSISVIAISAQLRYAYEA